MLEGSFAVFVVFYFFYNLYSVYKVGVKAYVSSVLNLIDLASSGLFFTTIAFHAMYLINMRQVFLIAEDEYKDFQIAAFLYPLNLPHLRWDSARPCRICTWGWARSCVICTLTLV